MRIERMLGIVIILLNRRRITAKELAEHFEVNIRTIYRDIKAINMANIPIISNQGMDGGYELVEQFKLNKHHFSSKDMKAILTALKGVHSAVKDIELSMVLEKIENLMPSKEKEQLKKHPYIIFDQSGWYHKEEEQKGMEILYEAVKNQCLVNINYKDSKGSISERIVEPMSIVLKGSAWYLFAFCREKKDFRMFKVKRMKKIEPLELMFDRQNKEYEDVKYNYKPIPLTRFVLKFHEKVEHVVKDYFRDGDYTETQNGFFTLSFKAPLDPWMIGLILSYGEHVELLEPVSLRKDLKSILEKTLKQYQ